MRATSADLSASVQRYIGLVAERERALFTLEGVTGHFWTAGGEGSQLGERAFETYLPHLCSGGCVTRRLWDLTHPESCVAKKFRLLRVRESESAVKFPRSSFEAGVSMGILRKFVDVGTGGLVDVGIKEGAVYAVIEEDVIEGDTEKLRNPEKPLKTLGELCSYLSLIAELGVVLSPIQAIRHWPHVFYEREARKAATKAKGGHVSPEVTWWERFAGGEKRKAWDDHFYSPGEFCLRYGLLGDAGTGRDTFSHISLCHSLCHTQCSLGEYRENIISAVGQYRRGVCVVRRPRLYTYNYTKNDIVSKKKSHPRLVGLEYYFKGEGEGEAVTKEWRGPHETRRKGGESWAERWRPGVQ